MKDKFAGNRVHLYEYGEAYDDLRSAFYIDERAYADPDVARTVTEAADAAMTRMGVIYSVQVTSGTDAQVPFGVPTWEQFKQRHFIEGAPLPVRPKPRETVVPPSWDEMNTAIGAAHIAFREELIGTLTNAFPGSRVFIRQDYGPLRRSAGSIDWSEEKFGFELLVRALVDDLDPAQALERIVELLHQADWQFEDEASPSGLTAEGLRDGFDLWIQAGPGYVEVEGRSPLYRAPADPGSPFVVEPRPPLP